MLMHSIIYYILHNQLQMLPIYMSIYVMYSHMNICEINIYVCVFIYIYIYISPHKQEKTQSHLRV